jgi:hypothetical protein
MMGDVADELKIGSGGSPAAADPATVFAALANIIYQGSESSEIYAAICVAATLVVNGCDHASLLVRSNNRYITVGASDRIAQRIDDLERMAGDGPCVDAIEEETPQVRTNGPVWPPAWSPRPPSAGRWAFASWWIGANPVH